MFVILRWVTLVAEYINSLEDQRWKSKKITGLKNWSPFFRIRLHVLVLKVSGDKTVDKTDTGVSYCSRFVSFLIVFVKSHGQLKHNKDARIFEQKLVIVKIKALAQWYWRVAVYNQINLWPLVEFQCKIILLYHYFVMFWQFLGFGPKNKILEEKEWFCILNTGNWLSSFFQKQYRDDRTLAISCCT